MSLRLIFCWMFFSVHFRQKNGKMYDNLGSDIDGLSLGKLLPVPNQRIAIVTGNAVKERRDYIATHFRIIRKPFKLETLEKAFV